MIDEPPFVSVVVVTYNHAQFLEEALSSVFAQKTIYSFEVIVADDASVDGTQEVIRAFDEKYPGRMSTIFQECNVGPTRNLQACLEVARGEYLSFLEGDDYWLLDTKLQTAVDFLEENTEFIAFSSRHAVVDKSSNVIEWAYSETGQSSAGKYCIDDFLQDRYAGLVGCFVSRNKLTRDDKAIIGSADKFIFDITLNCIFCLKGSIYISDEQQAAHRVVIDPSASNYKSKIMRKCQIAARIKYRERLRRFALAGYGQELHFKSRRLHFLFYSFAFVARYPSFHNVRNLVSVARHCLGTLSCLRS